MAPLDNEDMERLRESFVTRREFEAKVEEINGKLSNDMKELAVINTKLSLILWLLGAVGAAVITVLIKLLFGA